MTENTLFATEDNPTRNKVERAQEILRLLDFDDERCNERSALTFLALLGHHPETSWSQSTNEAMRTFEIMERLRVDFGKNYKPNTRETIRRETLHQFLDAGLVEQNPDDPSRPTNSPKSCYRISPRALALIQSYTEQEFSRLLREYLNDLPGLKAKYARLRELNRIPVTLPDGSPIDLSPGGQNLLIRDILEEFCPQFTPGGQVLYVGDADRKWAKVETEAFQDLGINDLNEHGKMPDLVVYMPDKNWLILLEAASSHGPVDAKRRDELERLFFDSSAGLVYVSCFPSRKEMRKYLTDIAWETEIWCADSPSHLIHFNGERFLGPYT
ncbi:BsuBI/PstI family type II restriction endonuclease [Nonomuraea glycinis]|uniref:BsuBI/PstI family type II restriction endonuclease n=1 Tax=Nonomuraea glycinis TaxID=2047744 RepID=UPI0033A3D2B5